MRNENRDGFIKTLMIVIGAIVSICAIMAVAYVLFKKFFQVSFECEGDGGMADEDDPFAEDEDAAFEPICCCDEEKEIKTDDAAADEDDCCCNEEKSEPENA